LPGAASRFILIDPSGQNSGPLVSSQQIGDGAMTALNGYVLSGAYNGGGTGTPFGSLGDNVLSYPYTIQDIVGDASFAIGRWARGSVTFGSGAPDTLTGTDGRAYHYIVYQEASAFPGRVLYCAGGNFTTPTYTDGGNGAALTGTSVSGEAAIVFTNGTGNGWVQISANVNGETANAIFQTMLLAPFSMSATNLGTNGSGVTVQLTDAGHGAYALATAFAAVTPSGAHYIGVGRLNCISN
jgi:hypothetical protein